MADIPANGSYLFTAHWLLQLPKELPPQHFDFCRQQLSEVMPDMDIGDDLANLASGSPALLTYYAQEVRREHQDIGISAVVGHADHKTVRQVSKQSMLLPQPSPLTFTGQLLSGLPIPGTAAMHKTHSFAAGLQM